MVVVVGQIHTAVNRPVSMFMNVPEAAALPYSTKPATITPPPPPIVLPPAMKIYT